MKRRRFIAAAALLPFAARAADAPLKIGSPAGPFGDILALRSSVPMHRVWR